MKKGITPVERELNQELNALDILKTRDCHCNYVTLGKRQSQRLPSLPVKYGDYTWLALFPWFLVYLTTKFSIFGHLNEINKLHGKYLPKGDKMKHNLNRCISINESELISKTFPQRKLEGHMVSLVNSLKCLGEKNHQSYTNYFRK